MNIKKLSILFLIILITISILYDNLYTTGIISGEYAYRFTLSGPEGPQQGDKLTLKKDVTFQSDTWGNGTYKKMGRIRSELQNSIWSSRIQYDNLQAILLRRTST